MVKYMVAHRADVQLKSAQGKTALHFAAEASQQNVDLVNFLLEKGVEASKADIKGQIPLHYAILSRNFQVARRLMQERFNGEDPPLDYVRTALFEAATGDSVSTVEFITSCYDPPSADVHRVLVEAVKRDRFRIVKHLIENGVNVRGATFQGRTLLHEAATNGAIHSIDLLLQQGLNVREADKFGATPVLEASRHGHTDTVSCLLQASGSINDRDLAGQTALHLAAQGGHNETVRVLVENGADISSCDKRGWTPLHHAAAGGFGPVMKALIARGAPLYSKTNSGYTAEMLAMQGGYSDVVKFSTMDGPNDPGFEKYKEYLLDDMDIHLTSITQVEQEGPWLGAPIQVKLRRQQWTSQSFGEALDRWSKLNHPHILKLYGFSHGDRIRREPYFVYERPAYDRILDLFDADKPATTNDIWGKLYQAALGMQYLHNRDIVHGYLDISSLAVASNGDAKLHVFNGTMADFTSTPETLVGLPPTYESDVYAFGLLLVDAITKGARCSGGVYDSDDTNDAILCGKLPNKPEVMTTSQWQLIERMCRYNPSDRPTMTDIVRELEGFSKATLTSDEFCTDWKVSDTGVALWSSLGDIRIGHISVSNLLGQVEAMCEESTGVATIVTEMQRGVCDRLLDILEQLKTQTGKPDLKTVERFGKLLRYFLMCLQKASEGDSSLAASLAASSQGANDIYSVHQDIDMFADSAGLSRSHQVHQWKDLWQLRRRKLELGTLEQLGHLPSLLEEVEDDKEREELLINLRFELSKHPVSYATSNETNLKLAKAAVGRLSTARNPSWFIPAHEVKFDKYDEFSRGSFGKVYHGSWNRSRVVVKRVELNSEEDEEAFLNEVEVWHQLYHPNVVRLYGACHVQRPFFVCEFAGGGQLDHFVKEHPDKLWQKLYESAQGLRYLHWKRIVHGDLKCNNILVGSDGEARLTDFGLSIVVSDANGNSAELDSNPKMSYGAIRWKAPEVLQGKKSTFASDVYSFGMCIIEAVTGKFPWGSLPDIVVRHHVLEDKNIPLQPENCIQEVYTLVERMCRFDPCERIGMNTIVDELGALT